jgi:hypothetical protein
MTPRLLPFAAMTVALAAIGCSDAPARPAKLGLYMMIRNPDPIPEVAGRSCPTSTGVEWDIGKATRSGGVVTNVDSPSPTDFGTTLEDGKSATNISCTIRKSGSVDSDGGGTDPQITPPGGLINFVMSGTAKKSGTPATNLISLSVYTPLTFQLSSNPGFPGCSITSVHEQAPGALWADFSCPALTNPSEPNRACKATGTIVLEYCKTGEEEE